MSRSGWASVWAAGMTCSLAVGAGCAAVTDHEPEETAPQVEVETGEVSPESLASRLAGKRLFEKETFGGNGRTCATCHVAESGALSPSDVQKAYAKDPRDPL